MKKLGAALAAVTFALLPSGLEAQLLNDAKLVGESEAVIPNPFSPFGNSLEVSKYGDDGSSVVKDDSGVLIWVDASGFFRILPDSDLAVPLTVTNNEVIVWKNRYVQFDNYENRPQAEVAIYRLDAAGNLQDAEPLAVLGKKIIATPQVTTSTGNFVIATSEVILDDNKTVDEVITNIELGLTGITFEGYIDNLTIRYYNVTAGGDVQYLNEYSDQIRRNPVNAEPEEVQTASDLEVLGHGSDGSSLIKYTADIPRLTGEGARRIETKHVWVNSKGVARTLEDEAGVNLVEGARRVINVTDRRLVIEETQGAGLTDFRRDVFSDQLSAPATIALNSSVLAFPNYTKVGDDKFFYSVDEDGTKVNTLRLTSDGVKLERTADLGPLGVAIAVDAQVKIINPVDGSAIIKDQNQANLIWLHDQGAGFVVIENSQQARAAYVSGEQCVLWENATAPIPEGGLPEPAVAVHHELNAGGNGTIRTPLDINGTYVIDVSPYTPSLASWQLNTAEKIKADTALVRSYRLITSGAGGAPLGNLSTRAFIGNGDRVLIAGIIVEGTGTKRVLITGRGASVNVPGNISDTQLRVVNQATKKNVAISDDYSVENQAADIKATNRVTTIEPTDAAVILELTPGAYTVLVSGKSGETGLGIVEIFDLEPGSSARITNLSTRGYIGTDDKIMIGGLIVARNNGDFATMLARGKGPSSAAYQPGLWLADPLFEIYEGQKKILENDDWASDPGSGDIPIKLRPGSPSEPALRLDVPAGSVRTVHLKGANGTQGIGIIEFFVLD